VVAGRLRMFPWASRFITARLTSNLSYIQMLKLKYNIKPLNATYVIPVNEIVTYDLHFSMLHYKLHILILQ
jgi:hypothetical protein